MIAVGLFVTSCDDFLDERPQSVASAANFYKSDSDIENAVNACYATLQMSQLYRDFMITMTETRSDNVEDQNPVVMPAGIITSISLPPELTMRPLLLCGSIATMLLCVVMPYLITSVSALTLRSSSDMKVTMFASD